MNELLRFLTWGHKTECCFLDFLVIAIWYVTMFLQVGVIVYAWGVTKKTYGIKYWSQAWTVFLGVIILITVRRGFTMHTYLDVIDVHDGRFSLNFLGDNIFLVLISLGWFVFVYKVKAFLKHYYTTKDS